MHGRQQNSKGESGYADSYRGVLQLCVTQCHVQRVYWLQLSFSLVSVLCGWDRLDTLLTITYISKEPWAVGQRDSGAIVTINLLFGEVKLIQLLFD